MLFSRRATLLVAGSLASPALINPALAQGGGFVTVGGGPPGGTAFPVGAAVAQAIGQAMPGVRAQMQQTGGSFENIQLVGRGRAEFGLSVADSLTIGFTGRDPQRFPRALTGLRVVASLLPFHVHILMRADAGVRRIEDLRGKRITVGAAGGGTEGNARAIFAAAGLSFADLGRVEFLSGNETVDAIRDRRIDGMFLTTGIGASALRDLAGSVPVVAVPVPHALIARMNDPAYAPAEITAGTYPVQGLPVETAVIWFQLFCDERLPAATVTAALEGIFGNLAQFRAAHPGLRDFDLPTTNQGWSIPGHPAAIAFLRARGVAVGA